MPYIQLFEYFVVIDSHVGSVIFLLLATLEPSDLANNVPLPSFEHILRIDWIFEFVCRDLLYHVNTGNTIKIA